MHDINLAAFIIIFGALVEPSNANLASVELGMSRRLKDASEGVELIVKSYSVELLLLIYCHQEEKDLCNCVPSLARRFL